MEQKMPFFKYHPDPIATGMVRACDDKTRLICDCCEKPTKYWYYSPFYWHVEGYDNDENPTLCPDCIASGEAAKKYNGVFTSPDHCQFVNDHEKIEELYYRTPAFESLQQGEWLAHCGDFCAFIGLARSWSDIEEMGLADAVIEGLAEKPCEFTLENIQGNLGCTLEMGYLFRCLHCGKVFLYVDRD